MQPLRGKDGVIQRKTVEMPVGDARKCATSKRASECVHLALQQMHALAGASGLYWAGTFSPADRLKAALQLTFETCDGLSLH